MQVDTRARKPQVTRLCTFRRGFSRASVTWRNKNPHPR